MSTAFMKLKPADPLRTIVAMLSEENSPYIISLDTLATMTLISRAWLPSRNDIVVLEVKYVSASCAYSESVVQWIELEGHKEHEVALG